MQAFRICSARLPELDGEGAHPVGGRWNTPGHAIVYTASSRTLAAMETLVHFGPEDAPDDLVLLTIELPDASPEIVDPADLPGDWMTRIDDPVLKAVGDAWVEAGRTLLLSVPAAPMPEERNCLINPRHPDAAAVRTVSTRPFTCDPRLLR